MRTIYWGRIGSDDMKYVLLGFDAPCKDDPIWRFWVEITDDNGASDTYDAGISENDKGFIKRMYEEYVEEVTVCS